MHHKLNFSKLHGLGNDFILIDAINQRLDNLDYAKLAVNLCSRNFGIGADGLILVLASEKQDIKMRIFNSDGSEPEMCGNGIRCFARFVYENKLIEKEVFSVETNAGVIIPALVLKDGLVEAVEVDMGVPILDAAKIPLTGFTGSKIIAQDIEVDGQTFKFTPVSMGNPHAVVFLKDLKTLDINKLGPKFEKHEYFPQKINTEFVQVLNPKEAVVIVWERGAGETLACGTGACATVVAGVLNGVLERKVTVHLPGGDLNIEWQESDSHVIMTGPAQMVYTGEIEI
jgi:diaminopimelate epimerase